MRSKSFSNKNISANGNTWTVSGRIEVEGEKVKVKVSERNGCVNDKEGFEEAVQNMLFIEGYMGGAK